MWAKLLSRLHPEPTQHAEAAQAIQSADESLRNAVKRNREVKKVAADLRYHREINHFAERIKASMREA